MPEAKVRIGPCRCPHCKDRFTIAVEAFGNYWLNCPNDECREWIQAVPVEGA